MAFVDSMLRRFEQLSAADCQREVLYTAKLIRTDWLSSPLFLGMIALSDAWEQHLALGERASCDTVHERIDTTSIPPSAALELESIKKYLRAEVSRTVSRWDMQDVRQRLALTPAPRIDEHPELYGLLLENGTVSWQRWLDLHELFERAVVLQRSVAKDALQKLLRLHPAGFDVDLTDPASALIEHELLAFPTWERWAPTLLGLNIPFGNVYRLTRDGIQAHSLA